MFDDPSRIDHRLDARSISFENPEGERGAGGKAANGRKGAPARVVKPGETVTLADIRGPGRITHMWATVPPSAPEKMRALTLEVSYDGAAEPSVCTPLLDFFGAPQGRPVAYVSALTAVQEGRGFNAFFPMPFRERLVMTVTNGGPDPVILFYQIDYVLGRQAADIGYLHATFRRENPTELKRDFVILDGLKGPGRFLGCCVGIRVLPDGMGWYGEGEVKIYRDGDRAYPTYCGTGLEDYVGSAWGMGAHAAPFAGAPLVEEHPTGSPHAAMPRHVGFYRWHVPDPIVFRREIRVTIQQIGAVTVLRGPDQEQQLRAYMERYEAAGLGWRVDHPLYRGTPIYAFATAERRDDYCATAFAYCRTPQPVARFRPQDATADLEGG